MRRQTNSYPNTAPVWSQGEYKQSMETALRRLWPNRRSAGALRVLYIGGGDGRSLQELLELNESQDLTVDFVEPQTENLNSAKIKIEKVRTARHRINWLEKTVEKHLIDDPHSRYDLVVALLVFHYLNADWPSVIRTIAERTNEHGGLIFDELSGADDENDSILRTIDQTDCERTGASSPIEASLEKVNKTFRDRIYSDGRLWNVPLKASDMSALAISLPLFGYVSADGSNPHYLSPREVFLRDEHLPWAWGSSNATKDNPLKFDDRMNRLSIKERWWTWRKQGVAMLGDDSEQLARNCAASRGFDSLSRVYSLEEVNTSERLQDKMPGFVMPRLLLSTLLNCGLTDYDSTINSAFIANSANTLLTDAHSLDEFLLFVRDKKFPAILNTWKSHLRFFTARNIPSISTQLLKVSEARLVHGSKAQVDKNLELPDSIKQVKLTGYKASFPQFAEKRDDRVQHFIQWESRAFLGAKMREELTVNDDTSRLYDVVYQQCNETDCEHDDLRFLNPLLSRCGSLFLFPIRGAWSVVGSNQWKPENFLLFGLAYSEVNTASVNEALRLRERLVIESQRLNDQLFYSRWKTRFVRRSRDAAIAAIAAQSLSHNIGSHALSDAKLFNELAFPDGEGLKDFHQYLQGRMDYVAQLIARTPPQPEPMYLWGDVLGEFFRQRLLLNRLVADRSVEGPNISFTVELPLNGKPVGEDTEKCGSREEAVNKMRELLKARSNVVTDRDNETLPNEKAVRERLVALRKPLIFSSKMSGADQWWQLLGVSWADIKLALGLCAVKDDKPGKRTGIPMVGPLEDLLVAIPGGGVGRHALYGILENLMRNSVKYGEKRDLLSGLEKNSIQISMRLRSPEDDEDYYLFELWDNFSGFSRNTEQGRYSKMTDCFETDVINKEDDEGRTRNSGHGLVEIKEAMRFLHDHKNSPKKDEGGIPSPWACRPCHRTSPNHPKDSCGKACQKGQSSCCDANLANVFDPDYDGRKPSENNNDQGIGTLVYRVRLQRPHLLGVWTPDLEDDEAACSSVSKGVFFRKFLIEEDGKKSSLANLSPHLLVIRDPFTDRIGAITEELARWHWRLPFRLFVVTGDTTRRDQWERELEAWAAKIPASPPKNNQAQTDDSPTHESEKPLFLPRKRVRVIHAPHLHAKLATPIKCNRDLTLVNEVYDHWLMAFKPLPVGAFEDGRKWHLAVCFQRDKDTIKKLWAAANDDSVKGLQSLSVSTYCEEITSTRSGSEKTNVRVAGIHLTDDNQVASRLVFFGNHDCRPPGSCFGSALDNKKVAFGQEFGSKEAPRTFNLLYSPPSDAAGFSFFALSIVEAALTNVAIFDERTTGVFLSSTSAKEFSRERPGEAFLARLHPLLTVESYGAPFGALSVEDLHWTEMQLLPPIIPSTDFLFPCLTTEGLELKPLDKQSGADVLVLHEGLIEELVSKGKYLRGSELCYLSRFPQIVRTSGKGRDPRKLDVRLPFCEYSAISAVLAPYLGDEKERVRLDKIILAKSVLNTFGQMEKEGTKP